jgi:hypothetical protein
MRPVLDTAAMVAAIRSNTGASRTCFVRHFNERA